MNEHNNNLTLDDGTLSEESINLLRKYSDMIECKCPEKLLDVLVIIRDFKNYIEKCFNLYSDDAKVHAWLKSSANNLDKLITSTLLQLARMEGFIDEYNYIKRRN